MTDNKIVAIELKNAENSLSKQMDNLKNVNYELERIQFIINDIVNLVLSSEKISDIDLIINKINNQLKFVNDEFSLFKADSSADSKDLLWSLLKYIQDIYADKESEKGNIEEEIKRIEKEINEILEVLQSEKGKRL